MAAPKSNDPIKTSTRTILALIQAKKLRAAARELKKLDPYRKKIYGYDRLIGAVHGPLNNAEKLCFEARAMVPDILGEGEGDAKTQSGRIRQAIRRLMKSRAIVRDDPAINHLLKHCLGVIQQAENQVSSAQTLALRGDWHSAYRQIKEAVKIDNSPEARETHKFIAQYHTMQVRDEKKFQAAMKTARWGVALLLVIVFAVFAYTCNLRQEADDYRRHKEREAGLRPPATAPGHLATAAATPPPEQNTPAQAVEAPPPVLDTPAAVIPPVEPAVPVEKNLTIDSEAESGTSLGQLEAGTQITLRYQSGKWRSWIQNGGFSPDVPSEGGKVHSLSIRAVKEDGTLKVLAVVPYHTQETPFTYEVPGKYQNVFLRINEEAGKLGNNDGVVTYGVRVVPAKH